MNIFLPYKQPENSFFEEIIPHSKNIFTYGTFLEFDKCYETVVIQWPELIFEWKEPTETDLHTLETEIQTWKKTARIIYVVHNLERHYGMTSAFKALYDIVQTNCDVMVHFGNASRNIFRKKYPSKLHRVINHPLYLNSFCSFKKDEARKKLAIDETTLVVLIPGTIRNMEERKMVIQAFKSLKQKDKLLLATNMKKINFPFDFAGRVRLKKILDVKQQYESWKNYRFSKAPYRFNYSFLSKKEFSLYVAAADVVLIPRIKILNSGNVFLGMTFKKIIIGPNLGNVKETLEKFDFPIFDPSQFISVKKALKKAAEMASNSYQYDTEKLAQYQPVDVAEKWDELFNELINESV